MSSTPAACLLIFRESTPEAYSGLTPQQLEACLDDWNAWFDGLVQSGLLIDGRPLEAQGRIVSGPAGRVLDGPFAEAKETVGGYFLLAVDSLDEATEIARQCPNLKHGMTVEVRSVAGGCHLAKSLGRETMRA
ncbi:MAG: hypothetical protein KF774_06830 [Planctomyces sp.]|nr:hypothetical protein [Planctomyces sp.]